MFLANKRTNLLTYIHEKDVILLLRYKFRFYNQLIDGFSNTSPVHSIEGAGSPVTEQRNSARWPCWTVSTGDWIFTVGFVTSTTASKKQLATCRKERNVFTLFNLTSKQA